MKKYLIKKLCFALILMLVLSCLPLQMIAARDPYGIQYDTNTPASDLELKQGQGIERDEKFAHSFAKDRVIVRVAYTPHIRSEKRITDEIFGIAYSDIHLLNPSKDYIPSMERGERIYSTADISETQNNVFVLTLEESGKESVERALKKLNANPLVDIAEPDYIAEFYSISNGPNDPMFPMQYALERISAQQAWSITTGSKDVVVGIVDSGIDGTHPDLIDNLWVNPNPNQFGFYNDIHGFDFHRGVGGIPTDASGHGTHVAGIAGARGDNEIGITGVNWNVSLAWLGIGTPISSSFAIAAMNYAQLHEIPITNHSYGTPNFS